MLTKGDKILLTVGICTIFLMAFLYHSHGSAEMVKVIPTIHNMYIGDPSELILDEHGTPDMTFNFSGLEGEVTIFVYATETDTPYVAVIKNGAVHATGNLYNNK